MSNTAHLLLLVLNHPIIAYLSTVMLLYVMLEMWANQILPEINVADIVAARLCVWNSHQKSDIKLCNQSERQGGKLLFYDQ